MVLLLIFETLKTIKNYVTPVVSLFVQKKKEKKIIYTSPWHHLDHQKVDFQQMFHHISVGPIKFYSCKV